MPKSTHLEAQPFGNGVYRFALGDREIYELENGHAMGGLRRVDVKPKPIFEIFSSIMAGRIDGGDGATIGNPFVAKASSADICQVVRLGLIGGARGTVDGREVQVDDYEATRLVRAYGPPNRPLSELWDIAAALVYAHLMGISADAAA